MACDCIVGAQPLARRAAPDVCGSAAAGDAYGVLEDCATSDKAGGGLGAVDASWEAACLQADCHLCKCVPEGKEGGGLAR